MNTKRREIGTVVGAFLVVIYALFPVAWILSLSFKAGDDINNKQFLPKKWTLDNYRNVFKTDLFTSALRNSIGISLIATLISVMIATVAEYAIARLDFPFKRVILSVALGIAVFPAISLVGPLFDMWRSLGLFDTWLGLIIPFISFT